MAHIRKCILCGDEYEYCPRCDKTKPSFYLKYCSENCKEIALIDNKYKFNHLTAEEALNELNKLDLSKLESFNEIIKERIKKILSTKKVAKDKVEEKDKENEDTSVEEETETIEPGEIIVPAKPKFKRSNKKN